MWSAPHVILIALWVLWALIALWCWYNVNLFVRRMRKQGVYPDGTAEAEQPDAVVIVPIKGIDAGLDEHVRGLANQRYRRYRLLFVVESEDDPAYAALQPYLRTGGEGESLTSIRLIVAGRASRGGQKVHNQLAALRALEPNDQAVVFADADAVPDELWLWRLATFLRRNQVGVTTGYRWFVPTDPTMPSRLLSVLNSSIATLLGPSRRNFAWGGSMAFRRDELPEQQVIENFDGALSDDYQLTRTCREQGRRVYFVMRCLVASPVSTTWGKLLEFGRRQYVITRIHAPAIWMVGWLSTTVYTAAWLAALAAIAMQVGGWGWALTAMGVVYLADIGRAGRRASAVREAFDHETAAKLRGAMLLDRWATPLVMAVHAVIIWSSAIGRTITWAGVRYRMRGRREVEIVERG